MESGSPESFWLSNGAGADRRERHQALRHRPRVIRNGLAVITILAAVVHARRKEQSAVISKLPVHQRLTAVQGQLDDAPVIAEAVRGSAAVLSTLGPTTKKADAPPLVTGHRNIVAAMHEHGVSKAATEESPRQAAAR